MNHDLQSLTGATLRTLPRSLRILFTCFLITIGLGYLAAMYLLFVQDIDPHRRMGMALVPGVAVKYYGDRGNTRLESALRGSMSGRIEAADRDRVIAWLRAGAAPDGFAAVQPVFDRNCVACHSAKSGLPVPPLTNFQEVKALAQVDTGPTLGALARVSHVHLFGISIIFLMTGAIFAMSEIAQGWRLAILALPYLTIWADIGAWWVTKVEPVFAWVVVVGGALMGVALATQILVSLWEMWLAVPRSDPASPHASSAPRRDGKPGDAT